jgi:bacteriocin-like protein
MNKQPEDKTATTITPDQPGKQPAGALTEKELEKVSGGGGHISAADEAPKEAITFEYGRVQVDYKQQKPDGTL